MSSRGRFPCVTGAVMLALLVFVLSAAAPTRAQQQKTRKQVAPWLVFNQEKGLDRIRQHADILSSLSVFGDPTREFIEECHELKIEVYTHRRRRATCRAGSTRPGYGTSVCRSISTPRTRSCTSSTPVMPRAPGLTSEPSTNWICPESDSGTSASVDEPTWRTVRGWLSKQ